MRVGFTGTQQGMTPNQRVSLSNSLSLIYINQLLLGNEEFFFHHGDCIGSDEAAAGLARYLGYVIVGHPPKNPYKRTYFRSDILNEEKEYIERNHDIVDVCDRLIATPKETSEVLRSGTWATVRYARKVGRPVEILLP